MTNLNNIGVNHFLAPTGRQDFGVMPQAPPVPANL